MKRTNILFWSILILFVGFAFWILSTGKLDFLSGSFVDGVWNSIENTLRPIFRR